MRAIVQAAYGDPEDVLTWSEVDLPEVSPGEVRVRVHATPVTGTDWHLCKGLPYLARPAIGLRRPKRPIPGLELAGTVEAVGEGVTRLKPGDEVFGWCTGAYAEYVSVPEVQLVPKPQNLTLEQAAAVPIAAFTALQAVRDKGGIQPGQKVLVTGASGGVGTYAVQLAKAQGAEVTAVCSTGKLDLVRSLGADHVIDYTREPLTARGERYDVLLDIYGNPSLGTCRQVLRRGGILVFIGGTGGRWFMGTDRWLRGWLLAPFLGLKARPLVHADRREDLENIAARIECDELKPVLDRTFPLAEAAAAIRFVAEGRARGQVVLTP